MTSHNQPCTAHGIVHRPGSQAHRECPDNNPNRNAARSAELNISLSNDLVTSSQSDSDMKKMKEEYWEEIKDVVDEFNDDYLDEGLVMKAQGATVTAHDLFIDNETVIARVTATDLPQEAQFIYDIDMMDQDLNLSDNAREAIAWKLNDQLTLLSQEYGAYGSPTITNISQDGSSIDMDIPLSPIDDVDDIDNGIYYDVSSTMSDYIGEATRLRQESMRKGSPVGSLGQSLLDEYEKFASNE